MSIEFSSRMDSIIKDMSINLLQTNEIIFDLFNRIIVIVFMRDLTEHMNDSDNSIPTSESHYRSFVVYIAFTFSMLTSYVHYRYPIESY
jgi:hypothetical protein